MMRRWLFVAPLALAACTVGPNYRRPADATPAAYAEPPPAATGAVDLATWWTAFHDPELDRLVAAALAGNLDVKSAVSRIREARWSLAAARASLFPTVDATGNVTNLKLSKNAGISSIAGLFGGSGGAAGGGSGGGAGGSSQSGGITVPGGSITTYSLGFDASWEIDLFGGTRRAVEGARARVEAAEWDARDAAVSLVAEVARDYLDLRAQQHREAIARAEIARQARSLSLMGDTARVGLVPQGDTARQRAQLAGAQAALTPILAQERAQIHAIALLLATTSDKLDPALAAERADPPPPPAVPPGLPSELLRRRPDIRAAERRLAAATADIGVAVADLYPRFNLTGMAQLVSTSLANLFTGNSLQTNASAAFSFPLLDFGRRRAQVKVRREQAEQAYYAYQKTVLSALRDVDDALSQLEAEQRRNAVLRAGEADAERAARAVSARYTVGLVDLTAVLDAQANVLTIRDQRAASDGQLRSDLVALYKALGGGWSRQAG